MLLQTRPALRRGVPCLARKVNYALNQNQRRKTLMATAAREDVAGGCTAFAAASLLITTKITASAARASPRPASAKRQQQTVLERHNLNARRPEMGGCKKSQPHGGPRARPDFGAKLEMLKLMDNKVTHEQKADRFWCSERLVRDVNENREKYETETARKGGGGSQKTYAQATFRRCATLLFEKIHLEKKDICCFPASWCWRLFFAEPFMLAGPFFFAGFFIFRRTCFCYPCSFCLMRPF